MKAMHTIKAKAIDLEHAVIGEGEGEEDTKKAEEAGKAGDTTTLADDSETEKVRPFFGLNRLAFLY